ncbi:MAG: YfcE family phosphodiesterase [Oscillospiraceae bacterium]|nr:YfcE family phosphodiesterase [Oscillospiraceae bacterium]
MKILVMSDSHNYTKSMLKAVELETPDTIVHLGDYDRDCAKLKLEHPEIEFCTVRGNGDYLSSGKDSDEFVVGGKRFFITHGHLFGVKKDLTPLISYANDNKYDVLLFGHTHIPHYSVSGDMAIVNPGSIGAAGNAYAVLELKNGAITCELKSV